MEEYKEYYKKFGGDRGDGGEGGENEGVLSIEGSELRGKMEWMMESVYRKLCSVEILEAESRAESRKREVMEEKMARKRREKEEEKKRENKLMEEMEEDLKLMEDLEELQLLPIKHNVIKELKRRFKEEEMIRKRTKKQEKKKTIHCEHDKEEYYCEHNFEKYYCEKCIILKLCKHKETEAYCTICGPKRYPEYWCKKCNYTLVYEGRFKPYCVPCYYNINPKKDKKRYIIKENYLREELCKRLPNVKMIFNKKIVGGCSSVRPDVRIECYTHTIIIECDERSHIGYNCENMRMMTIFQDLGNRPIVFLRFNPDEYMDKNDKIVRGCFMRNKKIRNVLREEEWENRIKELINQIINYKNNIPKKEVTIENLFYANENYKKYLYSEYRRKKTNNKMNKSKKRI
jgi:hypothetical protein